ncbi:MAG TPA: preprotein translocase subunit SecY [Fimbriimonadaceae bacterium]|nr:preprotein translocase subunit SecY [Fimbriimonadaceae bacterium]
MALGAGSGGGMRGDKGLRMPLTETLRLAWADQELRQRIMFVLMMFAIYALGVHVPVPIPGVNAALFEQKIQDNAFFALMNTFGGGSLKRISIFALGLNPYITSSIIMQILTQAFPQWKKELQEGGEYARRNQNRRTRALTLILCVFQGTGFLTLMKDAIGPQSTLTLATIVVFWTAGAMAMLWMGEQISERGIGNGVSLMIFAGIVISVPNLASMVYRAVVEQGAVTYWQLAILAVLFLATTWIVVLFTIAQRRIPIQHMRRQFGTKVVGGATSYLPLSINLAGVIPIIFAISLLYMPAQFASMFPAKSGFHEFFQAIADFLRMDLRTWHGWIGAVIYTFMIFFFTYFYTAIQYNVEDIANNLKRGGSYVPGVRPGKQTKEFLDGVISRITIVGAMFLSLIALTQFFVPLIAPGLGTINVNLLFGTSLLIMVSVALETMRQIEANILMKQYGG